MKLFLLIILLSSSLFSHKILLNLIDNEDGTIIIEGAFDTGGTAAGALIKVESLLSSKILFEKRLPNESELIFKIPDEPYKVILAGGKGHEVIQVGPAPLLGFTKKAKINISVNKKVSKRTNTLTILWSICICLLSLILFFWLRNTKKLILLLKHSK